MKKKTLGILLLSVFMLVGCGFEPTSTSSVEQSRSLFESESKRSWISNENSSSHQSSEPQSFDEQSSDSYSVVESKYEESSSIPEYPSGQSSSISTCKQHQWIDLGYAVDPTCQQEGLSLFRCLECGEVKNEVVDKIDHDYSYFAIDEAGHHYECVMCHLPNPDSYEPHVYKEYVECEPDDWNEGLIGHQCTTCGYHYSTTTETVHVYHSFSRRVTSEEALVSPATCESPAYYRYTCERCDMVDPDGDNLFFVTGLLPHDFEFDHIDYAKTCREADYEVSICKNCGFESHKFLERHDHIYNDEYEEYSWGNEYSHLKRCVCGETITDMRPHEVTVSAMDENGVMHVKCDACGFEADQEYLFEINEEENYITINGLKNWFSTELIIPSQINGVPVKRIKALTNNGNSSIYSDITTITVQEGIEVLEYGALSYFYEVKEINLPETLLRIEEASITGDHKLESLRIPDNVEYLGRSLFDECCSLKTLIIGKNVKQLDRFIVAEDLQSSLHEIYNLSEYLTNEDIENHWMLGSKGPGSECYFHTSLSEPSVYYQEGKYTYYNSKDGKKILSKFDGDYLTELEIADDVDVLGSYFAYRQNFGVDNTGLVIPSNIKAIGDFAFGYCYLNDLILNEGLEYIGERAFSINNIGTLVIPNSVKTIESSAFYSANIESLQIGSGLTEITHGCFSRNDIKNLVIPDNVTSIGPYAFDNCQSLTNVTLPNHAIKIGIGAFRFSNNIEYVEYEDCLYLGNQENPHLVLVSTTDASKETYSIHPNTKTIASETFLDNISIKSISFPDNVEIIGDGAFKGCKNLSQIDFGSVKEICDSAFDGCAITHLTTPSTLKTIGPVAFAGCKNLTTVVLNEGLETLGYNAFKSCTTLHWVELPSTLHKLESGTFDYCGEMFVFVPDTIEVIETHAFGSNAFGSYPTTAHILYKGQPITWNAIEFGENEEVDVLYLLSNVIPDDVAGVLVEGNYWSFDGEDIVEVYYKVQYGIDEGGNQYLDISYGDAWSYQRP